jgi:hypothetical protein
MVVLDFHQCLAAELAAVEAVLSSFRLCRDQLQAVVVAELGALMVQGQQDNLEAHLIREM